MNLTVGLQRGFPGSMDTVRQFSNVIRENMGIYRDTQYVDCKKLQEIEVSVKKE
jgi:hypothetical protein